ncbi:uncharacterized protein LOC109725561 [Ananas comosus]|uniref:Uncharacterized protein LOC109725561 n=1 Tax=Ananas comosus TaxID=4615 RepID=A0A6P5GRF1_ANACO|nr:uncharacterized protein LOC109725561 [Ananas comosus]
MTYVRILIALAASCIWPFYQLDVKNAFLHGDLHEEIYMQPPLGLSHSSSHVCRLWKALYGLKQAPRVWFEKFQSTILSFGFHQSENDHALFIHTSARGLIALLLYVDDMIITCDDLDCIHSVKSYLQQQFDKKDLGPLRYFLGIKVAYSPRGYILSQQKYTADLLSRAELTDTGTVSTPMQLHQKLTPTMGEPLTNPTRYRELVGALVYLTISRPDIAYAVHIVSQFMQAPTSVHYVALLRILRYLRGSIHQSLFFSSSSKPQLRAYCDADWAGDLTDRWSTTGYCVFFGNSLISWRSKKQDIVAKSSTEAEYRAMSSAASEIVWLRRLLGDLGVQCSTSTPLYCHNQSAIKIANNPVFHERTKHIEIDRHFVRHYYINGSISLPFIPSAQQLADFFTKSQTTQRHQYLLSKLSVFTSP